MRSADRGTGARGHRASFGDYENVLKLWQWMHIPVNIVKIT